MARYEIQQADPSDTWLSEPGRWRGAIRDGIRTATVSCPGCAASASLSGHTIGPTGDVSPSLMCPFDGCGFHEFVTLVGWSGLRRGWMTTVSVSGAWVAGPSKLRGEPGASTTPALVLPDTDATRDALAERMAHHLRDVSLADVVAEEVRAALDDVLGEIG